METDEHDPRSRLRELPKVDEVLRRPELSLEDLPRWALVEAVRREVEHLRQGILSGRSSSVELASEDVLGHARRLCRPSLTKVINATGVVLHTNLGRAPLAEEAAARAAEMARSYSNLEYDIEERARGSRHDHLRSLLSHLTGAPAAVVVNNNAGSVLLALAALAAGKEVIVSRGELIEIGGSFRVPDVMRASGARLVEVGTTNKTKAADYEGAVGVDTALLMKVHRSNFAMVGFVEEVSYEDMVAIGARSGVPVLIDLGSGTLVDPASLEGAGLPREPTVGEAVRAGAALVTFSGDKLLGGPQAGIIVGSEEAVARVRRHPLMRALRPDKMTLAALEATLELYRDGIALSKVPVLRMLAATPNELEARAISLRDAIEHHLGSLRAEVTAITSAVGGGALPLAEPPSYAVSLAATDGRSATELDEAFRRCEPPVVGRIVEERLVLDVRTILPDEMPMVVAAVKEVGARAT
ncbi:MAG: L-seryl-tRNA(Sec) selenium transferase [Deltaproteobacteria bacterium]|nr:L-seryl-tRNA(Sec) selenium transferase [Deltaproteobacteria bacterium]